MTAVGELVGYLRLDTSEWDRKADQARVKIDEVARKSPTIKVQADTASALAKLEMVRAATLKVSAAEMSLSEARTRFGASSRQALTAEAGLITARNAATKAAIDMDNAEQRLNRTTTEANRLHYTFRQQLVAWGALLGTSIGPVLGAASAAVLGFGTALSVGVVGVLGIRDAMKAGTPLGNQYKQAFSGISQEFTTIKNIAAQNMFSGINNGLKALEPIFPVVNGYVADLATKMGQAFQIAAPGLAAALRALGPVVTQVGDLMLKAAQGFTNWTTGSGGFTKFINYSVTALPRVMDVLGNLVEALTKIVEAAAPFGGVVLKAIDDVAQAINRIPVGVLAVVVPALVALNVAMKGMAIVQTLSANMVKFGQSLGVVKAGEEAATAASATMTRSLGGIVGVLATLYIASQTFGDKFDGLVNKFANGKIMASENVDELQDLKSTYQQLTGGVSTTNKSLADFVFSTKFAKNGAGDFGDQIFDLMHKLNAAGVSTDQIKTAVEGSDDAFATFNKRLMDSGTITYQEGNLLDVLHDQFGGLGTAATTAASGVKTLAGAQVNAGVVIDGVTYSIDKQSTAAGVLQGAIERLNGASLNVEETENRFRDQVDQLTQSVHDNGRSIDQSSTKGRANREVLVGLIRAANDHAQATADLTAKTKGLAAGVQAGTTDLKNHEISIRNAAAAAGLDKGEVDKLIKSLGKIPKEVAPKITIHMSGQQALATVKQNIAALKSKQIDITTYVHNVILPTLDRSTNRGGTGEHSGSGRASGGLVTGPGTGTSDSIPTRLSNGEFVVNAAATARFLPMLHQINSSPAASGRAGGMAGGGYAYMAPATTADTYITVNVEGNVRSDKDLASVLVAEIDMRRRWKGDVGILDSWSGQKALQQPKVFTDTTNLAGIS